MLDDFNGFYICVILLPIALGMALYYGKIYGYKTIPGFVILWNIVLTLMLVSTLFAGMETYYRFFVDTTDSYSLNMISARWFKRHFSYNNIGVRDNVIYYPAKEPSKKHRITFFGDSFTEGHGVADVEDRFINLIRKDKPEWELQCMARKGNETNNEIKNLKATIENHFDMEYVVLCYVLNDISYLLPETKVVYDRIDGAYKKEMGFLDSSSYFMNTMYYRIKGSKDPAIYNYYNFVKKAYFNKKWDEQAESLRYFKDLVESRGGRLLVVTFPLLNTLEKNQEDDAIFNRLDSLWKSLHVPHLNLTSAYTGYKSTELVVNPYDAHPNEFAHRLAANAMEKFLENEIKKGEERP